jgi:LuxR family maltose regulon positive regulatory protein
LTRLLADNSHGLHYEPLFDARILMALALFRQHKFHQACQALVDFIRKAAPERILLPFLERGTELATLLLLVAETENLSREGKAFIDDLLGMLPHTTGTPAMSEYTLKALTTAASISPREQEILRLTSQGYSVREMANQLCLAESTVKTHLGNIYQKLGARSRTQAINRARELELIDAVPG